MMLRIIFATRPDHIPNLVLLDLHRENTRSEGGQLGPRGGQGLSHTPQDVQPARLCLCQRFPHQFGRDPPDLDVHLQRRDTIFGPGHFEVHITQVIL
jgi:hypothetical protein